MNSSRPVIILQDTLPHVYIIIPISTSQSKFNRTNPHVIARGDNTYIKVSNMQRVPMNNDSFLDIAKQHKVKPVSNFEKTLIIEKLQNLMLTSIKNQKQHCAEVNLVVPGAKVSFTEPVFDSLNKVNGTRHIEATILAIDSYLDKKYVVLNVLHATGNQTHMLRGKHLIVRELADLSNGIERGQAINRLKDVGLEM